ncbi:hypothetical protein MD588_11470 [Photobacterium sp. SDRW27]|uniref:hypothetical protein n=1 Tax=Photobacterium obscurum TaxID=2829490 RepID=UPI002244EE50|nr:hypothetical protein [Photobacterium obscurum]MCW8329427.1 hypothetical protein [Photobacterium obscurum]
MVKWIGLVLILVGLSVMTSGLISALMDLAAFLVLLCVVARKAMNKRLMSTVDEHFESLPEGDTENKDKIDISP